MLKITDNVYYVGVLNPGLRAFDIIMKTAYGTSYNSYLIKGEKTALIESVHAEFEEEFFANIEEITPIDKIDYIICNHTEPDHSGSMFKVLEANPNAVVYGTPIAINNLKHITNMSFKSVAVKKGDKLDLGDGLEFEFFPAPGLHWPDSMFTYLPAQNVLFTCDFFGSHYCEPYMFDKHIKYEEGFLAELKNYYDCIFGPFKKHVKNGLDIVKSLKFDYILDCHGPILHDRIDEVISLYEEWAVEEVGADVAIFYASAYGYTKEMAECYAEEFKKANKSVEIYDLELHQDNLAQAINAMNTAKSVVIGSLTLNKNTVDCVWGLIGASDAYNCLKKPAIVFGSYGWSGEAIGLISSTLKNFKYNVIGEVKCVFKPSEADLENVRKSAAELLAVLG